MQFNKDLALIGIGYWGKNLARNFNALGSLHTICDINPGHRAQYQLFYPNVNFTDSIDQALEHPQIRKIVIAVPTQFHYAIAKRALEHEKDVFVEKAMCSNSTEAFELKELAFERKRILMVGHLLNYHPCIQEIKKMLEEEALGQLYYMNFDRLNFGSKGAEKSALWAFAPHDISVMLNLCKPYSLASVTSKHKSYLFNQYYDETWMQFDYLENLSVRIHSSWISPFPERKMVICGSRASLVFDDMKNWDQKIMCCGHTIAKRESHLTFQQSEPHYISVKSQEPLYEECKHFLLCCQSRIEPLTNGEEGYQVMRLLDQVEANCESQIEKVY